MTTVSKETTNTSIKRVHVYTAASTTTIA